MKIRSHPESGLAQDQLEELAHRLTSRRRGWSIRIIEAIAEIDSALHRLENGLYGISEFSGEPIPFERLLLVPWARSGVNESE